MFQHLHVTVGRWRVGNGPGIAAVVGGAGDNGCPIGAAIGRINDVDIAYRPVEVQVMFWLDPTAQLSPPLGEVTVNEALLSQPASRAHSHQAA